MFAPSQADVRRFFCSAWAKSQAYQPMETIETLAAGWIAEHPEWHFFSTCHSLQNGHGAAERGPPVRTG